MALERKELVHLHSIISINIQHGAYEGGFICMMIMQGETCYSMQIWSLPDPMFGQQLGYHTLRH